MPISQNTYSVPNNFVQQYDLGQKKIRADLVDENFSDAAGVINTLLTDVTTNNAAAVHKTGTETIRGAKTFTDNVTFTGNVNLSGAEVTGVDSVPVGTIIWSASVIAPAGYLLCNGAVVSRVTYSKLFAAIGTAFGSGNGSTTFNLPNLINRFIEGGNSAGTVKAAGLPNITGGLTIGARNIDGATGAIGNLIRGQGIYGAADAPNVYVRFDFNASRSSTIYGNSATVQPPAVTALPCIKY